MVVKDKILIGISGGEFGVHCHVTALEIVSGHVTMHAELAARDSDQDFVLDRRGGSVPVWPFDGSPFFICQTTLPSLASSATSVVSA